MPDNNITQMTVLTIPTTSTAFMAVAAVVFSLSFLTVAADKFQSNNNQAVQFEWQILSAKNFSSQIRGHPYVLLLVTVPWCGESRSLMREISLKLAKDKQRYSSLKLMLIYNNVDKVLADSLGAVEEVTVLCYHHAVSYKYQGGLIVADILSSVNYLLSVVPENLPLRKINNSVDMEMFLASTDKAVLLLETCGWTSKVLAEFIANRTVLDNLPLQVLRDLNIEIDSSQADAGEKYMKHVVRSEIMISEDKDMCGRSPWVGAFRSENGTSFSVDKDMPTSFGTSCSFTEYKKFESFFSKFIAAAGDSYFPPQRQRYALLSDRLLLSPLTVEDSDLWSLIVSYAGCPDCTVKCKEEICLRDALEMNDQPVMELLEVENGLGPSLPIDKPSIILFVDRRSDSKETAKQSQEAVFAFKEFARLNWKSHQTSGRSSERLRKSLHNGKGSAGTYITSRLGVSPASDKVKDKTSVVIINDGKHVTFDNKALELQGSSLQEILTHLLKQKKHSKLSSLAKEAGFQLLSDDMDIKITSVLSHPMGTKNCDSAESLDADSTITNSPPRQEVEHLQPINLDPPYDDDDHKSSADLASKHAELVNSHQIFKHLEVVSSVLVDSKIQAFIEADKSESLEYHYDSYTGSFFFSDGNNKFLRSLTNDLEIPSVVIIDPISQHHYVLSKTTLSVSSISTFIDHFLNGSLIPYQRCGPLRKGIEMSHPPFVNFNFQEKNSIPSVTIETFAELVIGTSQSDAHNLTNAWHKDVVVLFSSSWCGFCQRMELVVREIYRALNGYVNLVKCGSESKELCSEDDFKDVISKLPTMYSIDCALNDCGQILKSSGQREVYPTLLLYPAKKKTAIPFDGNVIVTDMINFLASHGINSENLAKQKGTLWSENGNNNNDVTSRDAFSKVFSFEKDKHVVPVTDTTPEEVTINFAREKASLNLDVGSILVARERLDRLNPFSEAKILIVNANPELGFQGLILNKPIAWNNVLAYEDTEFLREAPISFGGPVIQEGRPLVSLTRSLMGHEYPQVIPTVYFLDQSATFDNIVKIKAGEQSALEYWFFWGYSGWNWDQLYNEISEAAWKQLEGGIEDLPWP